MNNLQLMATENFNGLSCDFYNHDDQILMTRNQIGTALGYIDPSKAIKDIHIRHKDRLDKFSRMAQLAPTSKIAKIDPPSGGLQTTYLYSQRGVFEICRWSRQPKADEFMDWVWDIIEKYRNGELTQRQPQQIETQVYTLNSHLQSQFLSVVEKRAKEAAIETVKEMMGDFKIQSPVINQTLNHPTPTIPNMSQQIDIIRDTIKPLAEAFNDGSSGFNATFRKVYAAMGCDWKYRRTRYRNKKGNRNIPSNFTLLESDKKLMKLYIDTVNRMLEEVETNN